MVNAGAPQSARASGARAVHSSPLAAALSAPTSPTDSEGLKEPPTRLCQVLWSPASQPALQASRSQDTLHRSSDRSPGKGSSRQVLSRPQSATNLRQASVQGSIASAELRTDWTFRQPDSVMRVEGNEGCVEFCRWAQSTKNGWRLLHDLFRSTSTLGSSNGSAHAGPTSKLFPVPRSRWVLSLKMFGFRNADWAAVVFDEIAKEIRNDKRGQGGFNDMMEPPAEPEITLPQLMRFQRRCLAVNSTLNCDDDQSPAARFCQICCQNRGTVLRAWLLDLDRRGTGRVAYVDFLHACRKLNFAAQGKLIWTNLRGDGVTPLELHELCAREAQNLEDFAELLWNTVGFDMDKAWAFLDTHNKNYLTFEEWSAGLRRLGFGGDARLLFKGLDESGLGRMKRRGFEYIGKLSRIAQSRLSGGLTCHDSIRDLIIWVQRELGGVDELITRLGLAGGQRDIVVAELAARLTALGFEGDALEASTRAARHEGGTTLSADALVQIISGEKVRPPGFASTWAKSTFSSSPSRGARLEERPAWNNSVEITSEVTEQTCSHQRECFGPRQTLSEIESRGVEQQRQSLPSGGTQTSLQRPNWHNGSVGSMNHKRISLHARRYFSDFTPKPVRDERRSIVRERLQQSYFSAQSARGSLATGR